MFVLDELDKIIERLLPKQQPSPTNTSNLPNIDRVEVANMNLVSRVIFQGSSDLDIVNLSNLQSRGHTQVGQLAHDSTPSADTIVGSLIRHHVLTKLMGLPERPYASAKLIICDSSSYKLLVKLNRLLQNSNLPTRSRCVLNRPPFSVTAVLHIEDLVETFASQYDKPLAINRGSIRDKTNYQYSLIKKIFPYVKMSDLFICLRREAADPYTTTGPNLNGYKQRLLQMLSLYARTSQLIDLNPVGKICTGVHHIYNNVIYIGETVGSNKMQTLAHITQLGVIAERILQITKNLKLDVQSITYRSKDINGHNQALAELLIASSKAGKLLSSGGEACQILIVDRYYDLQTPLHHASKYGSCLDQELHPSSSISEIRFENVDELDGTLYDYPLTDVLGRILGSNAQERATKYHLNAIKSIYTRLHEGYLLMLKLESSLIDLAKLSATESHIGDRLQRSMSAFKKLAECTATSVSATDLIRVACIFIDLVNMLEQGHIVSQKMSNKLKTIVNEVKTYILISKEFVKCLESKLDSDTNVSALHKKIILFKQLSESTMNLRSKLTCADMIKSMWADKLETTNFTRLSHSEKAANVNDRPIVVVMLAHTTFGEITEITSSVKALIRTYEKKKISQRVYFLVLSCGTAREFIGDL